MIKKTKKNYTAWEIDEKDFPINGTIEAQIQFIVGYGILAPSQHNTQPWQFVIKGDKLVVSADYTKILPVGDPTNIGLYIGLGACVENIIQAASYFGFSITQKFDDDNAVLTFTKHTNAKVHAKVLKNIKNRYSNKSTYQNKKISESKINQLMLTKTEDVNLVCITNNIALSKCSKIYMEAANAVASNKSFILELVEWLRINSTRKFDGMPGFTVGSSNLKSIIGKKLLKKKPELFIKTLGREKILIESAPMLAIWSTSARTASEIIKVGMSIERFWLRIVEIGLVAQPHTAIMSQKNLNLELQILLGLKSKPVFMMRVGYSNKHKQNTPRRIL